MLIATRREAGLTQAQLAERPGKPASFIAKIETEDTERLASFYRTYFSASIGEKYVNSLKGFESRFLSFDSGARLEVMRTAAFSPVKYDPGAQRIGLTHLAFAVGSEQGVDDLT